MARVSLLGGAYSSSSLIAAAQRCINLYIEKIPEETKEGVQAVHLLRPGRRFLGSPPAPDRGRCLYRATNDDLYAVIGPNVFYISPDFVFTNLGALVTGSRNPAYMADNGTDILLVDGSAQGYAIKMTTRVMIQVNDPNFLGADRVDYLDSFLTLNQPGTPNWYTSLSNQIAFIALDFGSKTAWPDNIVAIVAIEREIWLLGSLKSEIWFNAGSAGFAFQASPGVIIEHGCAAKYSVAKQDVKIYWLAQSPEGNRMVMASEGHTAKRISNHAIEAEFKRYPRVDDAIGGCFQWEGHAFYALHFPTADRTWVFDAAIPDPNVAWHEERFCDGNGVLHRMRDAFYAFAYDLNLALDWASGSLYAIDQDTFTDQVGLPPSPLNAGSPIVWIRSLPHIPAKSFERMTYNWLIADVEVGTGPGTQRTPLTVSPWSSGFSSGFGPQQVIEPPLISMRTSDDRGVTFGNKVMQSLGAQGEYATTVTWWNLGMSRDKVVELSGSTPQKFSLLGVFGDVELHET